MPTQTPTLAELFERVVHDRLRETFGGWLPARVESYDSSTNRATLQLLLLDDYEDEEGARKTEPFPPVNDIPVAWLSLGGKFVQRATVNTGDEGIYLAPARPTTKWLQAGGMVDPEDDDHHPLDGGVFLPIRVSDGGKNGDPMISISASDVQIGGSDKVMLKQDGLDFKLALVAAIAAETTAGHTVGAAALTALQSALASLAGATPNVGQPWPVCSTKLKGG